MGEAQAEVAVPATGRFAVARGRPATAGTEATATATAHTGIACTGALGIRLRGRAVRTFPVLTPLPHISAHVVDAQLVRRFRLDGMRGKERVAIIPRHIIGVVATTVLIAARGPAAASRKLPLRFGGQAEIRAGQLVEFLNKGLAVFPAYLFYGPLYISGKAGRIAAHHRSPQFLRYLSLADIVVAQRHLVRRLFITVGILLLRGGAHSKDATLNGNHLEPDAIGGVLPIMLTIVGTGIRRSATQLAASRTLGMIAPVYAILLHLTTGAALGMTAIIGTGI